MSDFGPTHPLTLALGLAAQALFSARILLQWVRSERARRVLVPEAFWYFSLVSALLMLGYALLRHDPIILLAQLISYGIYVRNLQLARAWGRLPGWVRALGYGLPALLVGAFAAANPQVELRRLLGGHIPGGVLLLGAVGQTVFLLRFVVQWLASERRGESVLPAAFWAVSLAASGLLLLYAALRADAVLLLGNGVGAVVYARNLVLLRRTPPPPPPAPGAGPGAAHPSPLPDHAPRYA